MARLIARWVVPTPGGPRKITFSPRSRNPSSCRLSICSRLMLGWKAKSNCTRVFTAGRREARMAVCSRCLQVRQHCPQSVSPVARRLLPKSDILESQLATSLEGRETNQVLCARMNK